jgi:hypothetical protein
MNLDPSAHDVISNDFMKACLLVLGIITRIRTKAAGPQKGDTHGDYSIGCLQEIKTIKKLR